MALTQKPIAARCFEDKAGPPAWKAKPSWYQVSANDRMIPPETQRWMAERMNPKKTIPAGKPCVLGLACRAIVALIEEAARSFA